jgi:hypothetical protein
VIKNKNRSVAQKAKRSAEGQGVMEEEARRNYSLYGCGICDFKVTVMSVAKKKQIYVYIKHDVGDSQNTTKYLFATAGTQNSNTYMFRPFLVAIIRFYIPGFKSMYNMPT